MGNAGACAPRAVLRTPEQLLLAAGGLEKVESIIKGWVEDGMPLGMTLDMFKQALQLDPEVDAEALFRVFDSDCNQKVDAFELISAVTFLAEAALEEKVEVLFPVFDFSREGRLNFDEVNILLQSVSRGLTKVCGSKSVGDEELIDACRRSFDAHNLRYDKQITREQAKRWMMNDVEVMSFVTSFHKACRLPQALEVLADQQRAQLELFASLGGESAAGAAVHDVLRSEPLQQALGGHTDEELHSLAVALASAGGADGVGRDLFARASQAWNAFGMVADAAGGVDAKDVGLLLWLSGGAEPAAGVAEQRLDQMDLTSPGDRVIRSAWVASCLQQQ